MIGSLKALALVLSAMVVLGAMGASTTFAADVFTAPPEGGTPVLTGTGHDSVFKITPAGGGTVPVECTTANFSATVENGAEEATVFASYVGKPNETPHGAACESAFGSVTVDMNGCDYKLTGNTTGSDEGKADATVWIQCKKVGEHIVLTQSLCTIKVPAQTPTSGGVIYANETENGKGVVKITATVTGITYTSEGSFCALGGVSSEGDNADYNGTAVITGYEDQCKAEECASGEFKEGKQVDVEVS
jgi:hypothetical protein